MGKGQTFRQSLMSVFVLASRFCVAQCVYAPQVRHCMCVSVCGRYWVSRSTLCSCCVWVYLYFVSINILNDHPEHTLNKFSENTILNSPWTDVLNTHFDRAILMRLNKHSKLGLNEHSLFELTFWTHYENLNHVYFGQYGNHDYLTWLFGGWYDQSLIPWYELF